jgi:hypothetical protein
MVDLDMSKGIFLRDGCVLRKDAVALAAGFNDKADEPQSRAIFHLEGDWHHLDVPTDGLISVTASENTAYFIGVSGLALEIPLSPSVTVKTFKQGIRMWAIQDVMDFGELTRIRSISGTPYCCGQCGQVYRLGNSDWVQADAGLRSEDGPDLEDIDGSGPKDLYVVGIGGAMYRFDGRHWHPVALPTNVHLSNVRCSTPDLYYACGDDGMILRGARDAWEIIGESIPDKNYWGLYILGDAVYLAHGKGIDRLQGDVIEPVDLKLEGKYTFHRLHGRDGQLWSFGEDHMLRFDGTDWSEIAIPVR